MPSFARTHQLKESLVYHIFNRGDDKRCLFHSDEDYQYFINLFSEYAKAQKVAIYHWVLMPNHYHLLAEFKEPEKMSSVMAGLSRAYVHYCHKKYNFVGHLWQGRFKSQPIQKELYIFSCGRYIERNPVKANIVTNAWEYPYSSAAFYCCDKKDNLTNENPLFSATFANESAERQNKYKEYLSAFSAEEDGLFKDVEFPRGSKAFQKRLVRQEGRFLPRRRGR